MVSAKSCTLPQIKTFFSTRIKSAIDNEIENSAIYNDYNIVSNC